MGLGHGNNETQKIPKKIQYFEQNKIEIGSIYANYNQSVAVDVNNNDLYIWGDSDDGIVSTKQVPEKMKLDGIDNINSVDLGGSFIGILNESKEESKEKEIVLKSGEEMTVRNNDAENSKTYNVYVKNQELFGDDDWIKIEQRSKYSLFPYFGHKFVENLVINKEKKMIELIKHSEIDTIYHSDIIGATFFVCYDVDDRVIKTKQNKKAFMHNSQSYSFSKIEEIAFKISKNKKTAFTANIYVEPHNANSIYFLKEFNL